MLIINIIALICSLFFLCIPLVPVFLHTCLTLLHIIPMLVTAILCASLGHLVSTSHDIARLHTPKPPLLTT